MTQRAFASRVWRYLKYRLYDERHFVYFAFLLDRPFPVFPAQAPLAIRCAGPEDLPRIERELFPYLGDVAEGDKRYFPLIGKEGISCFLAEEDGRLVHYSWLFTDLRHAPIMHTPLDKKKLRGGDVFIGPVFTLPSVRGRWVFPVVLQAIIEYVEQHTVARRVILFVFEKNPGAVAFFSRLGFQRL